MGTQRNVALAAWLLLALFSGFLAYTSRMHEVTHDLFHEMALAREALLLGEFPTHDVFAYTPTVNPSVHHEWGTGAIIYFATMGTGLGGYGLAVVKLSLMVMLWLILYRVSRLRGGHPYLFALLSFVVFPLLWVGFATVRAQLFTLVFLATQLWIQELDARGHRSAIAAWLCLLVFWLNIHAGFVVGVALMIAHTAERVALSCLRHRSLARVLGETWHLFAAAPFAAACLLLNPYGTQYITYLIHAIQLPRPAISEWQPLWFTYAPVWTLLAFAVSVALFVYSQRWLSSKSFTLQRFRGAAFLALSGYMALKHIRHGSLFAVLWIAWVPAWLSRTPLGKRLVHCLEQYDPSVRRVCKVVVVAYTSFAIFHMRSLPSMPATPMYSSACYPTGVVDYLESQAFIGNALTPFSVGAYLSWEMYPHVKVSLDGRYEVAYQEHVYPEHVDFFEARENWWQLLDKYPTDIAIMYAHAPVVNELPRLENSNEALTAEPWRVVYRDDSFVVIAAEHCTIATQLSTQPLHDGVKKAFSLSHAHWSRKTPQEIARK